MKDRFYPNHFAVDSATAKAIFGFDSETKETVEFKTEKALLDYCKGREDKPVILEEGTPLSFCLNLFNAGIPVILIPGMDTFQARKEHSRERTDRLDAETISKAYCKKRTGRLFKEVDVEISRMRIYLHAANRLKKTKFANLNRLQATIREYKAVGEDVEFIQSIIGIEDFTKLKELDEIKSLTCRIGKAERRVEKFFKLTTDPVIKEVYAYLIKEPGVGVNIAAIIIDALWNREFNNNMSKLKRYSGTAPKWKYKETGAREKRVDNNYSRSLTNALFQLEGMFIVKSNSHRVLIDGAYEYFMKRDSIVQRTDKDGKILRDAKRWRWAQIRIVWIWFRQFYRDIGHKLGNAEG